MVDCLDSNMMYIIQRLHCFEVVAYHVSLYPTIASTKDKAQPWVKGMVSLTLPISIVGVVSAINYSIHIMAKNHKSSFQTMGITEQDILIRVSSNGINDKYRYAEGLYVQSLSLKIDANTSSLIRRH